MTRTLILFFLMMSVATGFAQDCNLPGLIPFKKGKKWGYSDENKKIKITPKYEEVWQFHYSRPYTMVKVKGETKFINDKGEDEEEPPPQIDVLEETKIEVDAPRAWILKAKNGKVGIKSGSELLLDSTYDFAELNDGNKMALVRHSKNGWALYNIETKRLTSIAGYDSIAFIRHYVSEELGDPIMLAFKGGKAGWLSKGGKELVAPQYDKVIALNTRNSFIGVSKNKKWAIATYGGRLVTDFKYDAIEKQHYDDIYLFFVKLKENWFYIDCKGTEYFEK